MRKPNRMTSYVFMWEGQDGKRRWEAIESGQTEGFLKKLMDEGVHPATVMVAYAPILFHFVWPEFHQGLSDVNFHKIDEEIYGTAPIEKKKTRACRCSSGETEAEVQIRLDRAGRTVLRLRLWRTLSLSE